MFYKSYEVPFCNRFDRIAHKMKITVSFKDEVNEEAKQYNAAIKALICNPIDRLMAYFHNHRVEMEDNSNLYQNTKRINYNAALASIIDLCTAMVNDQTDMETGWVAKHIVAIMKVIDFDHCDNDEYIIPVVTGYCQAAMRIGFIKDWYDFGSEVNSVFDAYAYFLK